MTKAESGGMLVEQAIHHLDIWLWLYGTADSVYGVTSHVPLGGTYPAQQKAVENNAVLTVRFKNGGVGMMIKSWVAEIGNSGNGLITSRGSATLIQHRLRWKTHDMPTAEEFIAPVPDDDTYRNIHPRNVNDGIGRWQLRARVLRTGWNALRVKQYRQHTGALGAPALNSRRLPIALQIPASP